MLDMLFGFGNPVESVLNAFFSPFYYSIRFLIGFIDSGYTPGNFVFCFSLQIIMIVSIMILTKKEKDVSFFSVILFCLALPLLAVFAIIRIMPDKKGLGKQKMLGEK